MLYNQIRLCTHCHTATNKQRQQSPRRHSNEQRHCVRYNTIAMHVHKQWQYVQASNGKCAKRISEIVCKEHRQPSRRRFSLLVAEQFLVSFPMLRRVKRENRRRKKQNFKLFSNTETLHVYKQMLSIPTQCRRMPTQRHVVQRLANPMHTDNTHCEYNCRQTRRETSQIAIVDCICEPMNRQTNREFEKL